MTEQDIRLRRLAGQYLSAPAPARTVARALCGFQAQYPQNALHALSLRTDGEGPAQARLVKSWTLRGTIHLFSEDDLPVYLGLTAGDRSAATNGARRASGISVRAGRSRPRGRLISRM